MEEKDRMDNKDRTEEKDLLKDVEQEEKDGRKAALIRAAVTGAVFFILFAGIMVGVFTAGRKKAKETSNVEDTIRKYTKEKEEESPAPEEAKEEETPAPEKETPTPVRSPRKTAAPDIEEEEEEIQGTPAPEGPVMEENKKKDYSKIRFDIKRNLGEMEAYFKDDNLKALDDLANLDRYLAMSWSLRNTTDFYYYGDRNPQGEPEGYGVAVYADNEYYYGEWKDGQRSGGGKWIHFHIHNVKDHKDPITYHQYVGTFSKDLPNGAGQDHYEYDLSKVGEHQRLITNYICSYKDGLIDGDVYCTTTSAEGEYLDWTGKAKSGSFEYISEARDKKKRGPVLSDRENPDNYLWMSSYENQKIGVRNYISSAK
ncbi:MAG: hypothetical protein K6F53_10975 [Lachnospiraceae bacterium]|nr:hypothetical protein [Lachnospiraceae bacterium]